MSDKGLFSKFKTGLSKTSSQIASVFTGNRIDDDTWDELEERLIQSDMGYSLTVKLMETLKKHAGKHSTVADLMTMTSESAIKIFDRHKKADQEEDTQKPKITLVIGVNGAGKTTTIAKLAQKYNNESQKVLLCAADTFRAAAIDQLKSWAERIGVDILAPAEKADPAAAAFDAVKMAISQKYDTVIIDTAGRLQTKHNLMEELKKIYRVIEKAAGRTPDEVLLVLDGTTGQNAVSQVKLFNEAVPITHLVVTKLDGTAKGGIVLRIMDEFNIPVKYVGFGEKAEDLMDFDYEEYIRAIFAE